MPDGGVLAMIQIKQLAYWLRYTPEQMTAFGKA